MQQLMYQLNGWYGANGGVLPQYFALHLFCPVGTFC